MACYLPENTRERHDLPQAQPGMDGRRHRQPGAGWSITRSSFREDVDTEKAPPLSKALSSVPAFDFVALQLIYAVGVYGTIVVCPSVICTGYIVAKRCEIRPRLLLITNIKSHIGFQVTLKSSTLDDLEES